MVKGISKLPLRGLKGLLSSVFTLMNITLKSSTETYISNVF
ncbi:Mobile element protein [Candidatus Enterovibrio escicola]|uniref:Mobile element protein n=1 Tax=Candidatus Enterovibrio escicola TaxID=1927127 RepID=A0A2A5SZH3_9GAMM|nr:Mobile element protein [Candidatus Enterovibrio escacola]